MNIQTRPVETMQPLDRSFHRSHGGCCAEGSTGKMASIGDVLLRAHEGKQPPSMRQPFNRLRKHSTSLPKPDDYVLERLARVAYLVCAIIRQLFALVNDAVITTCTIQCDPLTCW